MKILPAFLGICAILLALPANAEETPSLFFTPAEIEKIETPGVGTQQALSDIHLGAVLYYGPNNWTIWLDGTPWTPATHRMDVQIVEVKPERVRLQFLNGARHPVRVQPQPIVLRPYQTWQAATGKIVEGR